MNDLQRHMDEQQEKHEKLMVGREPVSHVWIGRCSDPSYWYRSRIGDTVSVFAKDSYGYWTRDTGPMRLAQWIKEDDAVPVGPELKKAWAEGLADKCRDRLELNAKLDNPFKSIPAPQEPSDGSGGTKTPLEEIEALKAKVRELEAIIKDQNKELAWWESGCGG